MTKSQVAGPDVTIPSPRTQRIVPPLLEPGAGISIVAPAGVVDRTKLEGGLERLRSLGFGVKVYRDLFARDAIFAGDDSSRADELMRAFLDPDTQAVFAARGGYGCVRLLPYLDFAAIAANPKIFLGYSDNTVLHAALGKHCGLVTFHGPHVSDMHQAAGGMSARTAAALWRKLMAVGSPASSPDVLGETQQDLCPSAPAVEPLRAIAPGMSQARVVGGNLSLICSLLGTAYQLDTHGCILFLEDVDERPYRIDRFLQQLKLAGCFDQVAGVVLGAFTDCGAPDDTWTTEQVFAEHFASASFPVLEGLSAGHGDDNLTLPLGSEWRIDATAGVFRPLQEPWRTRELG